jgi:vacuolar-type H+-ATPase subunit I/STV1
VHSTPAGAAIEVDGKPVGLVTPADVSIPLGKHHVVRLTLEGYAALEHPLSELTAKTPPKPVELTLEPSTTASLKPRLAMADKKVRALEHKLKSLHARQSGFMVSNPKKELVLEHAIEETETKLEQAQAELDAIREELQKEQDKLPPK